MMAIITTIFGFVKKYPALTLCVITFLIGFGAGYFVFKNDSPGTGSDAVGIVIESLNSDLKKLKEEMRIDSLLAEGIRFEIAGLKVQRAIDSNRIALYDKQLASIKNKYEKITNRYNNVGADSIGVLFGRAFAY